MWYVYLDFQGHQVKLPFVFVSQDHAEWEVARWKQKHNMTGDPFTYVYILDDPVFPAIKEEQNLKGA